MPAAHVLTQKVGPDGAGPVENVGSTEEELYGFLAHVLRTHPGSTVGYVDREYAVVYPDGTRRYINWIPS